MSLSRLSISSERQVQRVRERRVDERKVKRRSRRVTNNGYSFGCPLVCMFGAEGTSFSGAPGEQRLKKRNRDGIDRSIASPRVVPSVVRFSLSNTRHREQAGKRSLKEMRLRSGGKRNTERKVDFSYTYPHTASPGIRRDFQLQGLSVLEFHSRSHCSRLLWWQGLWSVY